MRDPRSRESNEKMKPEKAQRYSEILRVMHGEMTARQICEACGYTDMNMVRPRITELVKLGMVVKAGTRYDNLTDRNVTVFRKIEKREEKPKPKPAVPVARERPAVPVTPEPNCDQLRLFA